MFSKIVVGVKSAKKDLDELKEIQVNSVKDN